MLMFLLFYFTRISLKCEEVPRMPLDVTVTQVFVAAGNGAKMSPLQWRHMSVKVAQITSNSTVCSTAWSG